MKHFLKALTLTLLAGVFLVTGCSRETQTSTSVPSANSSTQTTAAAPEVEYKDELHIAVPQEAPSLDLHKNSSSIARELGRGTIWEQLVTLNGNSEVVPELADHYEVSDDGKTYTFYLREGVLFHDGTEMTADDVVASMNRWINGFSTAKKQVGDSRFEKIDDYTVSITLETASLLFTSLIAGATQPAGIMPASVCADEDTKGFVKEYIGTGPYKFVEWKLNDSIELEKFDDYVPYGDPEQPLDGWSGYKHAYLQKIFLHSVQESTTRVAGLQTGQYDVEFGVDDQAYATISNIPNLDLLKYKSAEVALVFNKKEGLATDVNVRKAIRSLVNAEDMMVAHSGTDMYALSSSYMNEGQAFWISEVGDDYYNLNDPELAKQYFDAAGYDYETPFRILAATINNFDRIALVLQQELEDIGVPTELTLVDWPTLTQFRADPTKYDVFVTSFGNVPIPTLKLYLGATWPGWSDDPTLQELMLAIGTAKTMEEAKVAWDKAQLYCWEDYVPVIVLGTQYTGYGLNEKVEGAQLFNGLFYWNVKVQK
ncbi:MAG: ABC transporter substrate-binding protein [Sphaerochaetaceae bacterium]